jgi:hypothetical protein
MTDKKPILTIRYATTADSERLTDFRISQFKTAKEFELINSDLLSYQNGQIFIIESNKEIISTMQVEKCTTIEDFTDKCSGNIPNDFKELSTLYLSKGATNKAYRNVGLNSILRKITLETALADSSIMSLTGFAYENAPRLNLLHAIGYSFAEADIKYCNYTKPYGKMFFLKLSRSSFEYAHNFLSSDVYDIAKSFSVKIDI